MYIVEKEQTFMEEKKSETETIENTKPNVEAMIIDDEQQEDSSSMKRMEV